MELEKPGPAFQDVLNDHRSLLDRLAVIETEVEVDRVCSELRDLVPILEMHFEREERPGGMFANVRAQDPRQSGEIESLCSDHVLLVESILLLLERAAEVASFRVPAHDFLVDVHQFTTHLRRHEARENALLTDAHYHEEGGGD